MANRPIIRDVKRTDGIAGQYALTAHVDYPGEPDESHVVTFYGSDYGGPVFLDFNGRQVKVAQEVAHRCGDTLDEAWLRRFYGAPTD